MRILFAALLAALALSACGTVNHQPEVNQALYAWREATGCAVPFEPHLLRVADDASDRPSQQGRYVSASAPGAFLFYEPRLQVDLSKAERVAAFSRAIGDLMGVPVPSEDDAHYAISEQDAAKARARMLCR